MRPTVALFFLLSLSTLACNGVEIHSLYTGVPDDPARVTLPELARYLHGRSGGLITSTSTDTVASMSNMTFVWDPYDKMRILSPISVSLDSIQDLFTFDTDRFMQNSGSIDFLSASCDFIGRRPLDQRRLMYVRPYRTPDCWGSLFYPPIKTLTHPLAFYHSKFSDDFDPDTCVSRYFDPEFQKALDRETQTELTYGNELHALFNGEESYPEKLRLASEAKKFLYVALMAIVADETGREIIRIMVNRKRAGVDVRLVTDDFYTFSISQYAVGVLEREGIPVAHVADKRLNQLDRMFHNKFWIRDGEEAILGGMNILDYENRANGFNFLNRDTDVLIRGPAVTSLLERFLKIWKRYDREDISTALADSFLVQRLAQERSVGVRGSENYPRWLGNPATRMNGICRTAVQGDDADPQKIVTLLTRYLDASQHSFYTTSPEMEFDLDRSPSLSIDVLARLMKEKAGDTAFTTAFITNGIDGGLGESSAFLRGRVKDSQLVGDPLWEDMLTPIVDREGREVNLRVRNTIEPLIRAGLHGYQYFNYMHAKEFYFDRLLVGIGSWNFDLYSAENNHESVIFCLDKRLRLQIERRLVLDMINSVPIILQDTAR